MCLTRKGLNYNNRCSQSTFRHLQSRSHPNNHHRPRLLILSPYPLPHPRIKTPNNPLPALSEYQTLLLPFLLTSTHAAKYTDYSSSHQLHQPSIIIQLHPTYRMKYQPFETVDLSARNYLYPLGANIIQHILYRFSPQLRRSPFLTSLQCHTQANPPYEPHPHSPPNPSPSSSDLSSKDLVRISHPLTHLVEKMEIVYVYAKSKSKEVSEGVISF